MQITPSPHFTNTGQEINISYGLGRYRV